MEDHKNFQMSIANLRIDELLRKLEWVWFSGNAWSYWNQECQEYNDWQTSFLEEACPQEEVSNKKLIRMDLINANIKEIIA